MLGPYHERKQIGNRRQAIGNSQQAIGNRELAIPEISPEHLKNIEDVNICVVQHLYIGLDSDRVDATDCNYNSGWIVVTCLGVATFSQTCVLDTDICIRHGSVWRRVDAYGCVVDAYKCIRINMQYGCIYIYTAYIYKYISIYIYIYIKSGPALFRPT